MPSTSQTTPTARIDLGPDTDKNGHVPRRRASAKQSTSIVSTQWPLVTRTAYDQLVRGGKVPEELANLRLRRLCTARSMLGQTLLALAGVMHDHRPGQNGLTPQQIEQFARIWQWARAAHEKVEKEYVGVPLEVR